MKNDAATARNHKQAFLTASLSCALLLIAFYTCWFMLDEDIALSHNYRVSVKALLATEHIEQAVAVAKLAYERNPIDTDASYTYANALMIANKQDDALRQFERLFATPSRPNPRYNPINPGDTPLTIPTQRPFYHTQGRLAMARHHMESENPFQAIINAELARGFGMTTTADDRAFLHELYSEFSAWGRAFDFGQPSSGALTGMNSDALLTWMQYAASQQQWTACISASQVLLDKIPNHPQALFWMGRALLATNDAAGAAEALQAATDNGHPDAPFFLGLARESMNLPADLHALYQRTAPQSLYYPFSLAKAIEHTDRVDTPKRFDELQKRFQAWLETPPTIPAPHLTTHTPVMPLGITLHSESLEANAPFLAAMLWEQTGYTPGSAALPPTLSIGSPNHFTLLSGRHLLEVRFVRNMVPFGDFEGLPPDSQHIPGWQMHPASPPNAATIADPGLVRLHNGDATGMAAIQSCFLPVKAKAHYLIAVRCQSDSDGLFAGWTWHDAEENNVLDRNVLNTVAMPQMAWQAEYTRCPSNATTLRARAGLYHATGTADFNALLILPLDPPAFGLK